MNKQQRYWSRKTVALTLDEPEAHRIYGNHSGHRTTAWRLEPPDTAQVLLTGLC